MLGRSRDESTRFGIPPPRPGIAVDFRPFSRGVVRRRRRRFPPPLHPPLVILVLVLVLLLLQGCDDRVIVYLDEMRTREVRIVQRRELYRAEQAPGSSNGRSARSHGTQAIALPIPTALPPNPRSPYAWGEYVLVRR